MEQKRKLKGIVDLYAVEDERKNQKPEPHSTSSSAEVAPPNPTLGSLTPPKTTQPTALSPTIKEGSPVSPQRDFNKRANSLDRYALPAGLFPGSSKKLYDALYIRTRGAVTPIKTIRATRRELIEWSGIRNIKTIDAHLRYLSAIGLLVHHWERGHNEGSLYEVRLPEETTGLIPPKVGVGGVRPPEVELGGVTPPQDPLDRNLDIPLDQNLGLGGASQTTVNKGTYESPKTSLKTNINDDDEYGELIEVLKAMTAELTGKASHPHQREQWGEVGRLLVRELKEAADRAESVSSVPAFLAEHLRRRLARAERRVREGKRSVQVISRSAPVKTEPADRKLTPEEIAEQSMMIAELLESGYTIEQSEAQFAGSFHEDDWRVILEGAQKVRNVNRSD